ncbi:ribonuclease D [Candidatus Woesearchaeota archaeon]|nr:ribonuclease D [Candidatus Woesearchaeota archaeon]
MLPFTYITTHEQLKAAAKEWENLSELALDLECENNLHHYGTYISLIQLSTGTKHWIVDVLLVGDISPLLDVFRNKNVLKVLHDISFDVRILNSQFRCQLEPFFDTQLACFFLGKEQCGLGSLLGEYFGIEKDRKYQRVDWTRRPLKDDMLSYAITDAAHLLELKRRLIAELKVKARLEWVEQECRYHATQELNYQEQEYDDVSGVKRLPPVNRAVARVLFEERKRLAQKMDRPPFMIFANGILIELAQNPQTTVEFWRSVRGVHPMVHTDAEIFASRVKLALGECSANTACAKTVRLALTEEQKHQIDVITQRRNSLAEKLGMKAYLLIGTDDIREAVVSQSLDHVREWQRELLRKEKVVEF